ncbi:hypothetical protein N7456_010563 [Penicillium angulare]|uniref:Uncharacterized protein n=1 Tax=Penicillium angulare TaxID=116970 RepID=A0A9W9F712_9EURO|nr:hypothetical protein N7456_010563 [Penicillium angulare]
MTERDKRSDEKLVRFAMGLIRANELRLHPGYVPGVTPDCVKLPRHQERKVEDEDEKKLQ